MSHSALENFGQSLRAACLQRGISKFDLEGVFLVGQELRGELQAALVDLAPQDSADRTTAEILFLFDIVCVATGLDAVGKGQGPDSALTSAEMIDLWTVSTAGRALWLERFVRWPNHDRAQKQQHLLSTARLVGAQAIAQSVLRHGQALKFTEFVASLGATR